MIPARGSCGGRGIGLSGWPTLYGKFQARETPCLKETEQQQTKAETHSKLTFGGKRREEGGEGGVRKREPEQANTQIR